MLVVETYMEISLSCKIKAFDLGNPGREGSYLGCPTEASLSRAWMVLFMPQL